MTVATIGNISLMLSVKGVQFIAGMQKAAKTVDNFSKSASKMVVGTLAAGAAMASAAVVGMVAYAKRALESTAATTKLARSVNSSVAGLAALQHQIKSLGGDQADAAKGLAVLNEKLGEFGPEGEQARQMINRLGLSFDQLSKLPSDKAFAQIAEKIGNIADPARRAAAAVAIFGDEAEKLLPALTQGSAGLTAAQKAAEALGLSFSDLDASRVEDANTKLGVMSDVLHGLATQFAVQLAPWILKTADEISKLGVTGASVGKGMATAFRFVAKAFAFLAEYTHHEWIRTVNTIQDAFLLFIKLVSGELSKLFSLAAKLPDKLGGNMFKGAAEQADRISKAAMETIHNLDKEALAEWDSAKYTERVDQFFDNIVSGAEAGAQALSRMNDKLAKGALPIAQRFRKIFGAEANATIQEVLTPLEKYSRKLTQIKAMFQANALSANQFALATKNAVDELERAHGLGEVKLAGGMRRESSEALSAINQQDALVNLRFRQTPQQRVEALVKQSVEIERGILEAAKRIAAAVQQQPQLVPMP